MSVIVTAAVRVPAAVGVKVALMVQADPAATELPHVLVSVKSPLFDPAIARLEMSRVAFPVLVRVLVWAWLDVPTTWFP